MKKKVIEVVLLLEGIDKEIGGVGEIDLPRARWRLTRMRADLVRRTAFCEGADRFYMPADGKHEPPYTAFCSSFASFLMNLAISPGHR